MGIAALVVIALSVSVPHATDDAAETAAPKAPYASLKKCNLSEIMLSPDVGRSLGEVHERLLSHQRASVLIIAITIIIIWGRGLGG
jgi:hypothetical protein